MEGEQENKRIADKLLCQFTVISLLLLSFSNGSSKANTAWKVNFVNITAWKGSCAFFDCNYQQPKFQSQETLKNLTWIYKPSYDNKMKDWQGTIVYESESNKSDQKYINRVSFIGNMNSKCSLIIKDLQKKDNGNYGVRLMKENDKWMSRPFLSLNVTDSVPDPQIRVDKTIKEGEQITITCSVDYFCPDYPIYLKWERPMNETNTQSVKKDFSGPRTENKLTFTPSWTHHNKTLTCQLSTEQDKNATSKAEILLNVTYAPKNVQIYNGKKDGLTFTSSKETVKEGEGIALRCAEKSSNPAVMKYSWRKNEEDIYSGQTLEIQSIDVNSTGSYTCQADNGFRSTTSDPLEIDVQYAPRETRVQGNMESVKEGDLLILTCESLSNPPVTLYSWYKDHVLYPNHTEKKIHFSKLRDSDSGSYRCTVYNNLGKDTSLDEKVDVKYAPRSVEILRNLPEKQIKEGEIVTLTCSYNSSNPDVLNYTWWQNKKNLQLKTSKLQFKPISQNDSGEYKCEANNSIGTTSSKCITINVLFAPKEVTVEVLYEPVIKEGGFVILRCSAKASEPTATEFTWYKDRRIYPHSQGYELKFTKIQSTDAGDYECGARNEIAETKSKSVSVDVLYAPKDVRVSIYPDPALIEEYSDVMLECEAEANPKVSAYKWYYETQTQLLILVGNNQRLSLTKIRQDQAGKYLCEVFNNIGNISSKAVISVAYNSTSIIRFASLGIGLLFCLAVLILLTLRFILWKKKQRMPTVIQNPEAERSDSFFVMNKKHRDETADGRGKQNQASNHCTSEDVLNYASLRFSPIYTEEESEISRTSAANRSSIRLQAQDATAIYSMVQRPRRSLQGTQNVDYENFGEVGNARCEPGKDGDIHYASIVNLQCPPKAKKGNWESGFDANEKVQYAALKH